MRVDALDEHDGLPGGRRFAAGHGNEGHHGQKAKAAVAGRQVADRK
jgi:hypothetical protein